MASVTPSDKLDRAIMQLLMAHGMIEDSKFKVMVEIVAEDLQVDERNIINNITLSERFKNININIRPLSLEIKSVVTRENETAEWQYFHGIANTDEDLISTNSGSKFDQTQIEIFAEVLGVLLEKTYLSTGDVQDLKPSKWSNSECDNFLATLERLGWLRRNNRSYWEIGFKSHLELRPLLENLANGDDNIVKQFPQLIIY